MATSLYTDKRNTSTSWLPMIRIVCLLLYGVLLAAGQSQAAENEPWYSDEQVLQGERLFRQNCASCHGQNAEATADWKKTDANGNYPPPPLNGTAHTWHHDLELLRRTVREGGAKLGGQMPPFEAVLDAGEIDSVIAYFQSKWPDDIYRRWAERFRDSNLASLNESSATTRQSITRLLRERIGKVEIDDLRETELAGVWQAKVGSQYVYLLDDGRYVMMGELINLESGQNLTRQSRQAGIVETIAEFADEDLVVYAARGETRATLNVFTDTSCAYCQKLHGEIGYLQDAGITVRYLPFPRGGAKGPGYQTLKSVWCAQDRNRAMTDAKSQRLGNLPPGDCAASAVVDHGYRAGIRVGIRGTPALVKSDGEKIEGYLPYQKLIPRLLQ